jgi:hypothetical protein
MPPLKRTQAKKRNVNVNPCQEPIVLFVNHCRVEITIGSRGSTQSLNISSPDATLLVLPDAANSLGVCFSPIADDSSSPAKQAHKRYTGS